MATLPVSINYSKSRLHNNTIKIYTLTSKKEVVESFFEPPQEDVINIYGGFALPDTRIREYIDSTVELAPLYDKLFFKYMMQQPEERSEPMRESLSTLKPEIVGLSLGSIISFGVGVFALVTSNPGLATVMAGPFIASILGFSLLLIGLKRIK